MKLEDIYKSIDALNEAASMNISLTGDSPQEVGELFKVLGDKDINPIAPTGDMGYGFKAEPEDMGPDLGMRGDIEKSMAAIKGLDRPDMDDMPKGDMADMPKKLPMPDEPCGEDESDYSNSPDEKYQDTKYMTKDLSGGLNGPKKSYPKVAGGDNPMALEDKIREELKAKFAEKFGEAKDSFDEAGCKKEMKRLDASGCSKNEMLKKVDSKFGCGKEKFEKLYASSCGNH